MAGGFSDITSTQSITGTTMKGVLPRLRILPIAALLRQLKQLSSQ
jgi:hypothetical protein